jgi:hypothetical protein
VRNAGAGPRRPTAQLTPANFTTTTDQPFIANRGAGVSRHLAAIGPTVTADGSDARKRPSETRGLERMNRSAKGNELAVPTSQI